MYNPKHYQKNELEQIEEFIKTYSFATLISSVNDKIFVTHLPFISEKVGHTLRIYTHLAKANPHTQALKEKEVLIVFSGPHAYISSTWYVNKPNVSTWNYTAVHVSAIAHFMDETEQVQHLLTKTVAFYEQGKTEHHLQLPEEYKNAMTKEIVAIDFEIKNIEAKFKLSQNKPKEDVVAVIEQLKKNSENSTLVDLMKKENKL